MSNIKPTAFHTDPQKVPVVQDVHHDDVLKKANDYRTESGPTSAASQYVKNKASDLTSEDAIDDYLSAVDFDGGLTMDFDVIKKRVESSFGIGGSTSGLSNTVKNDIGTFLDETTGNENAKILFEGTLRNIPNTDKPMDARNIFDTVMDITGDEGFMDFLDIGAQAATINALASVLIGWGLPELIDKMIQNMKDDKARDKLYEENAIRAAKAGELYQCKYLLGKMGQGRAYQIHSTIIKELMKNYTRTDEEKRSYKEVGNDMLELFKWMNPNWDKDRYDLSITCLEYYTFANDDVVEALQWTDVAEYAKIGPLISIEPPLTTAGRLFPKMKVWSHSA